MMRRLLCVALLLALPAAGAWAEDLRAASRKAQVDRRAAEEAARAAEEHMLQDRQALLAEVSRLEAEEKSLEGAVRTLGETVRIKEKETAALAERWSGKEMQFREITGIFRSAAGDLETVLRQSPFTAESPEGLVRVQGMLAKGYFPGIDDITRLTEVYLEEIRRSGEVSGRRGLFVDRGGAEREGRILTLGKFTSVYQAEGETGFLQYSEEGRRFYALAALPSRSVRRNLERYLGGRAEAVALDLSGGAAFRQIIGRPGLWEHIRSGGPIVWPILGIGLVALLLVLERFRYLNRVHGNTDQVMDSINRMAARGEWEACGERLRDYQDKGWPVIEVLAAGLASRHEDRETQENVLQEAILREAPRLERFLSVLGIFGAIAPLLGLLGTVTGMISTFRTITLYGTGDPKLLSGGISEALVTTELGLGVAIPIMLLHTFLSRRVDHIIGDMEEKAVALTNIAQKERAQGGPAAPGG